MRSPILMVIFSLLLCAVHSQTQDNFVYIRDSRTPITDEEGRVTTLVTIENARQNLNTELAAVEGFRIETYRYLPEKMTHLIIEAPACEFLNQRAWSDGPIQLTSGDGRFAISGNGFLWDHQQSLLVISNAVRTVILPARGGSTETVETESDSRRIEVTSQRMNYDMASEVAAYEREVVVEDSEGLHLTSGRLAVHVSADAEEPDQLTAEENVVVDLTREGEAIRITGGRAEYEAGEDLEKTAVVTGDPAWRSERANGSGKRLVFDLTNNRFSVQTNAVITLQEPDSDEPPFTVRSHRYVYAEDAVEFTGGVSAARTNRLELDSRQMTARLKSRDEIEAIEASGEVEITIRDEGRLTQATAERMVYTHPDQPDESLRLTGNPEWRSDTHSGSADTMIHFPPTQRYLAEGHARARLNPREAFPDSDDQDSSRPGAITLGDEPLDVESRSYELTPEEGRFSGGVKVSQKNWRMTCESILIEITKETGRIREIAARENVFIEHDGDPESAGQNASSGTKETGFFGGENFGAPWNLRCEILTLLTDPKGQRIETILAERNVVMDQAGSQASGGKLRYRPSADLFELSESPVIVAEDGRTLHGDEDTLVFLDQVTGQFRVQGRYQIRIPHDTLRKASPEEKPLSRNNAVLFGEHTRPRVSRPAPPPVGTFAFGPTQASESPEQWHLARETSQDESWVERATRSRIAGSATRRPKRGRFPKMLWPEYRHFARSPVPSGGSPDGTGQWPVLPIAGISVHGKPRPPELDAPWGQEQERGQPGPLEPGFGNSRTRLSALLSSVHGEVGALPIQLSALHSAFI